MEVPLLYTTKGNIPESDCRPEPVWEVTNDYIKFILRYWLGDEIVKESAFILSKHALTSEAVAQPLV